MRLIDADALAEEYKATDANPSAKNYPWLLQDILEILDEAPTVDAAPVVHGRWENVHDGWGRCSNCHRMDEIHELATNCRFCGARMDGDSKAPTTPTTNHRVCKRCNTAVIGMEEYAECPECGHSFEEVAHA